MKFCSHCGSDALRYDIPEGDNRPRYWCPNCATIHYQNPKIIVGAVPVWGDKVLLCKRAIEPRKGYWTLPAGFMENKESSAEGAARETWEEAAAKAINLDLYRIFDVPYISQVYLFYRCQIEDEIFGVGPESLETALFSEQEIPWDELAFPVVHEILTEYLSDRKTEHFPIRNTVIDYSRRLPTAS